MSPSNNELRYAPGNYLVIATFKRFGESSRLVTVFDVATVTDTGTVTTVSDIAELLLDSYRANLDDLTYLYIRSLKENAQPGLYRIFIDTPDRTGGEPYRVVGITNLDPKRTIHDALRDMLVGPVAATPVVHFSYELLVGL